MSVPIRNAYRSFDPTIRAELGIYVYLLIDPRTRRVFYVGKGGGTSDGPGNSRVFHHFDEAARSAGNSAKLATIRAIWAEGMDVEWQIVRRRLMSEDEAFHVEAAIIDTLALSANGTPDNDQGGHGAALHAHIPPTQVLALGAPAVNPAKACTVFVFDINQEVARRGGIGEINADDLYAATRASWTIGKQFRNRPGMYAVGVIQGISYAAFAIERWEQIEVPADREAKKKKYAFSRQDTLSEEQAAMLQQLLLKNWNSVLQPIKRYRQRGRHVVVALQADGHFRYLVPETLAGSDSQQ